MRSKRRPAPEKSRSARGGGRDVGADRAAGGQRGRGVERVVGARDRQLDLEAVEDEARAARRQLRRRVEGPQPGAVAGQREQRRAIPHHGVLRRGEERAERRLDVALGGVGRVVVELGVREHRDLALELEQRAVGLVGLDDQPLPRPPAGVRAGRAHLPADEVAGSAPAPRSAWTSMLEVVVLPWVPETAIVGRRRVSSPSRSARCSSLAAARALRVLGRDRGRVDDLGAVRHVGGVVAHDRLDPGLAQTRGVGGAAGAVRAGDLGAELASRPARGRSSPRRRCPRSAGGGLTTPSPWRGRLARAAGYQRLPAESAVARQPPLPGFEHVARDVAGESSSIVNVPPPAVGLESTETLKVLSAPVIVRFARMRERGLEVDQRRARPCRTSRDPCGTSRASCGRCARRPWPRCPGPSCAGSGTPAGRSPRGSR